MKHSPYPTYKPSGIEWLGDVPEHWTPQRVRFCYSIQLGKMLQPEPAGPTDEETPYLKSQHVQWEMVCVENLPTMWTNKKERHQYAVKDGDLLVCEGGDVGRAAIVLGAPEGTIIQNALHRVRPLGANHTPFLLYVLAHATAQGWFGIICNRSTIAHFTVDKFRALGVALPPPAEQTAIAAYLDRETGRIDVLVEKKRTLIERLKEKRSALISACVTRGLPAGAGKKYPRILQIYAEEVQKSKHLRPSAQSADQLPENPPLKPSGIEWLGNVPKHWEVKRLKAFASYKVSNVDKDSKEGEIPVRLCNYTDVYYNDLISPDQDLMEATATADEIKRFHLKPDDIVITKDSEDWRDIAIPARVARTSYDLVCGYHLAIVSSERHVADGSYLLRSFQSKAINCQFQVAASGVTRYGLPKPAIGEAVFPLPPLPEQIAIAAYLDEETAIIDALVAKVETAIERLLEYRSALISAAVTGKIDVRKDASLPVEGPDR